MLVVPLTFATWAVAGRGWAMLGLAVWWAVRAPRPLLRAPRRRRRLPVWERRQILARDGYACQWCGSRDDLELDHVIPFSEGGACTRRNLRTLCRSCNRRRGTG